MLIHPWDAAISDTEWRNWLAEHDFGQLAVSDPGNGALCPPIPPPHLPAKTCPAWSAYSPCLASSSRVNARRSRPCQRSASDIDPAASGIRSASSRKKTAPAGRDAGKRAIRRSLIIA